MAWLGEQLNAILANPLRESILYSLASVGTVIVLQHAIDHAGRSPTIDQPLPEESPEESPEEPLEEPLEEPPNAETFEEEHLEDVTIYSPPAPNVPVPAIWGHPNTISYTPTQPYNQAIALRGHAQAQPLHAALVTLNVMLVFGMLSWLLYTCCRRTRNVPQAFVTPTPSGPAFTTSAPPPAAEQQVLPAANARDPPPVNVEDVPPVSNEDVPTATSKHVPPATNKHNPSAAQAQSSPSAQTQEPSKQSTTDDQKNKDPENKDQANLELGKLLQIKDDLVEKHYRDLLEKQSRQYEHLEKRRMAAVEMADRRLDERDALETKLRRQMKEKEQEHQADLDAAEDRLDDTRKHLSRKIKTLENDNEKFSARAEELLKEKDELEKKHREEIKSLQLENTDQHSLDLAKQENDRLTKQIAALEQQHRQEINDLKSSNQNDIDLAEERLQDNETLKKQVQVLENSNRATEWAIQSLEEKTGLEAELRQRVTELENKLQTISDSAQQEKIKFEEQISQQAAAHRQQVEELENKDLSSFDSAKEENRKLQQDYDALQKLYHTLQQENDAFKEETLQQNGAYEQQIGDMEDNRNISDFIIEEVKGEAEQLQQQLDLSKQTVDQLQAKLAKLQEELVEAQSHSHATEEQSQRLQKQVNQNIEINKRSLEQQRTKIAELEKQLVDAQSRANTAGERSQILQQQVDQNININKKSFELQRTEIDGLKKQLVDAQCRANTAEQALRQKFDAPLAKSVSATSTSTENTSEQDSSVAKTLDATKSTEEQTDNAAQTTVETPRMQQKPKSDGTPPASNSQNVKPSEANTQSNSKPPKAETVLSTTPSSPPKKTEKLGTSGDAASTVQSKVPTKPASTRLGVSALLKADAPVFMPGIFKIAKSDGTTPVPQVVPTSEIVEQTQPVTDEQNNNAVEPPKPGSEPKFTTSVDSGKSVPTQTSKPAPTSIKKPAAVNTTSAPSIQKAATDSPTTPLTGLVDRKGKAIDLASLINPELHLRAATRGTSPIMPGLVIPEMTENTTKTYHGMKGSRYADAGAVATAPPPKSTKPAYANFTGPAQGTDRRASDYQRYVASSGRRRSDNQSAASPTGRRPSSQQLYDSLANRQSSGPRGKNEPYEVLPIFDAEFATTQQCTRCDVTINDTPTFTFTKDHYPKCRAWDQQWAAKNFVDVKADGAEIKYPPHWHNELTERPDADPAWLVTARKAVEEHKAPTQSHSEEQVSTSTESKAPTPAPATQSSAPTEPKTSTPTPAAKIDTANLPAAATAAASKAPAARPAPQKTSWSDEVEEASASPALGTKSSVKIGDLLKTPVHELLGDQVKIPVREALGDAPTTPGPKTPAATDKSATKGGESVKKGGLGGSRYASSIPTPVTPSAKPASLQDLIAAAARGEEYEGEDEVKDGAKEGKGKEGSRGGKASGSKQGPWRGGRGRRR